MEELPLAVTFEVEPVHLSPLYRAGLLVVAVAMLLLPLVYVALVLLAGYGVWLHATRNHWIMGTGSAAVAVLGYLGPIVAGSLAVLFMVKPLFAPRPRRPPPRTVTPDEQPLLHAYVEALCASLGAPAPRRIDVDMQVNASASFRRGLGSFLGSDLVLTVGLPLTAGMTLGQWTGVLAHEFGHFTQGAAMRLSYVIGSVNHWFARVVYERDAWDARLERWQAESASGWGMVILAVSKGFIWLSRRILWMLMHVGAAVSAFLSRQMEFNADLHQARVSGSRVFRATHMRLPLLSVAWNQTTAYLGEMWRERRLVDDVVELFMVEVDRLTAAPEVTEQIEDAVGQEETGTFDTHPATSDRIRAVEEGSHPPRMDDERPAASLIRDFDALCREVTLGFYEGTLGEPVEARALVTTSEAVVEQEGRIESSKALDTWFMETPLMWMGFAPQESEEGVADLDEAERRLSEVRRQMAAGRDEVVEGMGRLDELAQARTAAAVYVRCLDAGMKEGDAVRLDGLRLEEGEDPDDHLLAMEGSLRQARSRLSAHVRTACRRMDVALSASEHDTVRAGVTRGADTLARLPRLLEALSALVGVWGRVRVVNQYLPELGVLLQVTGARAEGAMLEEIRSLWEAIHLQLEHVGRELDGVVYPYDHADETIDLGGYVLPELPPPSMDAANAGAAAAEAVSVLYGRIWADLAALALEVEDLVGVRPPELEAPEAPDVS